MTRYLLALTILVVGATAVHAQSDPMQTQALIQVDSKAPVIAATNNIEIKVNGRDTPLTGLAQVKPEEAQVALLIDDGLRLSLGRNLAELRSFIQGLPQGTEVLVGYMRSGGVAIAQSFTTDRAAAA